MSLLGAHLVIYDSTQSMSLSCPSHVSFWETTLSGPVFYRTDHSLVWKLAGCWSSPQSLDIGMSQELASFLPLSILTTLVIFQPYGMTDPLGFHMGSPDSHAPKPTPGFPHQTLFSTKVSVNSILPVALDKNLTGILDSFLSLTLHLIKYTIYSSWYKRYPCRVFLCL